MATNSADEERPVMSIEDFAASIAASLAAAAEPAQAAESVEEHGTAISFRERVEKRLGVAQLLVFRIAQELFAVDLVTAEEALDMPELHRLPEMPASMLGVFTLRGALVSVFEPNVALGIGCERPATAVVFCGGERRVAIATDDVDDVVTVDLRTVRDAPGSAARAKEGTLLGIVHRGTDLIALLDAEALVAAHRSATAALNESAEEPA